MKMAARLVDPKTGRIMEVRTTQPAVQLYTANHLGHTAVCLETQHHPDAIHHKNFPSIVIRPGAPLKESTLFTFLAERQTAQPVPANPTAVVVKKSEYYSREFSLKRAYPMGINIVVYALSHRERDRQFIQLNQIEWNCILLY